MRAPLRGVSHHFLTTRSDGGEFFFINFLLPMLIRVPKMERLLILGI